MSTPLADRVALVTGASRGIGRSIALALAGAGASVVAAATTEKGAEATCRKIREGGRRALAVTGDVSRPADVQRMVTEAVGAFGRVDLLVNCAGVVLRRPVSEMGDEDFDRVLRVNLSGPFYLARRLLPAMVQSGWGRVINISSISGTMGSEGMTGYCASKWGLNGLTKALAEETRGTGVLVAAVLPGSVDTEMLVGSGFPPAMGPEDVARVVLYLCSDAPAAMNGSLVEVFG